MAINGNAELDKHCANAYTLTWHKFELTEKRSFYGEYKAQQFTKQMTQAESKAKSAIDFNIINFYILMNLKKKTV